MADDNSEDLNFELYEVDANQSDNNEDGQDEDVPVNNSMLQRIDIAIIFDRAINLENILLDYSDDEKRKLFNARHGYFESTLLHSASEYNRLNFVKIMLENGADPNIKNESGQNALHVTCAAGEEYSQNTTIEIVKMLIERGCDIHAKDSRGKTPLHEAAESGLTEVIKILLDKNADMAAKDGSHGDQPIHDAAFGGHYSVMKVFFEANPECIHWKNADDVTVLHHLCFHDGNTEAVKFVLDKGVDVDPQHKVTGATPLNSAVSSPGNAEVVRLLLEAGADPNPPKMEKDDLSPLHSACRFGCTDIVSLLIKYGAKFDYEDLQEALTEGYEDIVKVLIGTPEWPLLLRHQYEGTTPFREIIKKMPDVAKDILNKCIVTDPDYPNIDDADYCVLFNYEFIEDSSDRDLLLTDSGAKANEERRQEKRERKKYGVSYSEIEAESWQREEDYETEWGPVEFKKANHPLAIMVRSKRLDLLTHPVVGSLLHRKWIKFGQPGYIVNLLTYILFLTFLTTFALIVKNPTSESCSNGTVNFNGNDTIDNNNCGISEVRLYFIYISAGIVILLALLRLIFEGIQLVSQRIRYITDVTNYMEVTLFVCSIIFVWVFHVNCLCPLNWQWQIGVVAVFLGWIVLINFISKLPLAGIYVLMFSKIIFTFLKVLILSILLVLAFGITFYLMFNEPDIMRSPFSTPARSLLKVMTMTTGELDYDGIFRQDPSGGSDDAEEIPFPPISYILWIIFLIIMPILLTNMLVGLAVDDIKEVQNQAALKKLALQVDQVLTIEELLPNTLRRKFTAGSMEVKPNKKLSWRNKLKYKMWGGGKYYTRASIISALHSHEEDEKKEINKKLLHEMEDIKNEIQKLMKCVTSKVVDNRTFL